MAYDTDKFFGSEGNFFQAEYQQVSKVLYARPSAVCKIQHHATVATP